MKSSVYHLQLNVSNPAVSIPFYRDLLMYLGYRIIEESPEHLGATDDGVDFWIIAADKKHAERAYHRKAPGLNHISFRVETRADVDLFCKDFLSSHKVTPLYGGAREFPEYSKGYYAVFFEDPDRIKIEVTYKPS